MCLCMRMDMDMGMDMNDTLNCLDEAAERAESGVLGRMSDSEQRVLRFEMRGCIETSCQKEKILYA